MTHPMSKKICRNSSLTLSSGCNAPPSVGAPAAAKLYFLNSAFFQAPDAIMSDVKSVSSFLTSSENCGPLAIK